MKLSYKDKIKELRNGAQETQAAIKIRDKLTELRSKDVLISSYRWIWELIQNAKDCPNSSGKIDIQINYDAGEKTVEFMHNGMLFSTKNIVYLIEQVSTKDRTRSSKSTGKFGTGFLTTNLLSPIVTISGLLHDDDDADIAHFEVKLDRSGNTIDELKTAIKNSCDQLESNTTSVHYPITGNEMNTVFSYKLDDNGMQTAKNGLENFLITAPYVFAFVPELNKITINNNGIVSEYTRTQEGSTRSHEIFVSRICKNNDNIPINILTIRRNTLMLAVEIKQLIDGNHIVAYDEELPKLFCDFPLLGTHDFSFPVVINSRHFDPNEPRNGIILYGGESEQNKSILQDACSLYASLIEYFIQYDYKDIHNVVRIHPVEKKDWIDRDWYEEYVILLLKKTISNFKIFIMADSSRRSLCNSQGVQQIFLPSSTTREMRETVWYLSSQLNPDKNVRFDDIENWYNSLWDECKNLDINQLISKVEEIGSFVQLSAKVSDAVEWLKRLYILLYDSRANNAGMVAFSSKIFPNQNGVFCSINQLKADGGIEEAYKEASKLISIDFKSELLDSRFISDNLSIISSMSFNEAANRMISSAQEHNNPEQFYKCIIGICCGRLAKQTRFIELYNSLFPNGQIVKTSVSHFNDRLLNDALKYWCRIICEDISKCSNLDVFCSDYGFASLEACEMWLTEYIKYLKTVDHIEFLDRYPIIPNQNGCFKVNSYLYYDVDSIPEFVKDVCLIAGTDFRNELASAKIDVSNIVPRKKGYKDISEVLTKYMREHMNSISVSPSDRESFNNTYKWLRENKDDRTIQQHFQELLNHLYWFYNDDEISESISKANELDSLLSKFGISDVKQLEIILAQKNSVTAPPSLTEELLCQYGVSSKEELQRLINSKVLDDNFLHLIDSSIEKFQFVQQIMQRALTNIQTYLRSLSDYDLSEIFMLHKTIFLAKKDGKETYIIARPSDYDEVILYYDAEFDTLDLTKDFELWVEDGKSNPQKLTFGRILKLTGVNRIPLRRLGR